MSLLRRHRDVEENWKKLILEKKIKVLQVKGDPYLVSQKEEKILLGF